MPGVRLAFIADIHGNQDALEAVLGDVRAQGAERLYVNGDVVNRGPDSVQALETLLNLPQTPSFVLGNHDDLMRLWLTRDGALPGDWFEDPFWAATAWSAEQLSRAGLIDTILNWPMTQQLSWGGLPTIEVAHGTAAHYRESLSVGTPESRLTELLGEAGAGVLIGSHTHKPMVRAVEGGRLVLNTGAVGAPFNEDPRAQYLLLDAVEGGWEPTIRCVPYDRSGVLGRFESSGLLSEGGVSAEIFREEVRLARSLYTPYWMWTEDAGKPRTPETWAQFQAEFPERFV
ncbi:metallophosphoesterase [Deinococcus irradiatisoli]|uniref:Metallophosphoesterase n=1 Tax=Deinococcus irradiatisoli TaxID=2202254 RepID=A0A2Z3JC00_9DEIO|nr:metallophosphoesterase family protein [Deinococcus irradiatisoli]AWN22562.1 metallophosphoesterase [Deinococcus irradiatisoli]